MHQNRIIVCGSRTLRDYGLVKSKLQIILSTITDIEIVSGCQISFDKDTGLYYGADYFGEKYAEEFNHPVKRFCADWNGFGKQAGFIRNKQMAEYGTHCIGFWDGYSKGTKMMIGLARDHSLKTRVVKF